MSENRPYEAVVMCTVFDEKNAFEDNLLIGIAHSPMEARSLLMDDIERVMDGFGNGKAEIRNSRSVYDEPITIIYTSNPDNGTYHWHYYCLFNEAKRRIKDD